MTGVRPEIADAGTEVDLDLDAGIEVDLPLTDEIGGRVPVVGAWESAVSLIGPVDRTAAESARARQSTLTKPPGALGRLEDLSVTLSAIYRVCPPPDPDPAVVVVFAGDHGVLAQGVTPWPAEVTTQMVLNFLAGGAAVNVLASQVGAEVVVVDVGVASDLAPAPGLVGAKVARGTRDLATEAAMTRDETMAALNVGAAIAADLAEKGFRCLLTGDMGIGNTTPSAALICAFTGRSPEVVTGRGTGIDDDRLAAKTAAIHKGLSRLPEWEAENAGSSTVSIPDHHDPIDVLAEVGGLEIAALAGFIVGGAAAGLPVVLDGVIAAAAAVTAAAVAPGCVEYLIAGHLSTEPGAAVALDHLGLKPLVDLELRLGEGTGACLALPLLKAAAGTLAGMATFESAGVTESNE